MRSAKNLVVPILGLIVVGAVAAALISQKQGRIDARKEDAVAAKERARTEARTDVLGHLEPCLDDTEWSEEEHRVSAAKTVSSDPEPSFTTSALGVACLANLDTIIADPGYVSPAGLAAIQRLRKVEDVLAHAYRDKAAFEAAVTERHAAFRAIRATVSPQLRATIETLLADHEKAHGRDLAWWRVDIKLVFWHVVELTILASTLEDTGTVDAMAASLAARAPVDKILADIDHAPMQIQKIVVQFNGFKSFTKPILEGQPLVASTVSLFIHNELSIGGDELVALQP